jgi:hypothetical protein
MSTHMSLTCWLVQYAAGSCLGVSLLTRPGACYALLQGNNGDDQFNGIPKLGNKRSVPHSYMVWLVGER